MWYSKVYLESGETCCLQLHDRKWRQQVPLKHWCGMISKNKVILYFSVTYILWQELKFLWCHLVQCAAKNILQNLIFQSSEMWCHIMCCSILELPVISVLIFVTMRTSNIIHNYIPLQLIVWRDDFKILLIMLTEFPFLGHTFYNVCISLNCIAFLFDY